MFEVENLHIHNNLPSPIEETVRYWDKAGSEGAGAYTAGVKMAKLKNGMFMVLDVVRGQWTASRREPRIRQTAALDGKNTRIYIEQEPGSGGKESAEYTIKGLAGYRIKADRPTGSKEVRAEPYSDQVQIGNVGLLKAPWNKDFIAEHESYPAGKYKDQIDAVAGAFNRLSRKKKIGVWGR
jgi:predicted phage terminase large subunit-like protein